MSAILKDPLVAMRHMKVEDLDEVFINELAAYSHPWTMTILQDCLKAGYHCQVAEFDGETVGHAVMSSAVGEAHLLNICIAPQWQGRGLGRRLLSRMLRIAHEKNVDTVFLEVRESNLPAQLLYQSEGFCEIGLRRSYYPCERKGRENAVVYAKPLV